MSKKEFQIFDALRILPKCYYNQLKEVSCVVSNLKPIAEPSNFEVNLTELSNSESEKQLSCVSDLFWYEADISYVKINMLVNAYNSVCCSPYISRDCQPMLCIGKVQFPLFKADRDIVSKFSRLCIFGSMKLVSLDGVYYLQMFKWSKQADGFKVTKVIYGAVPHEDAALTYLLKQDRSTQNALLRLKYKSRNIGISGDSSSQTGNFKDFTYIDPRTVVLSDKLVVSDTDVTEIQSKTDLNLSVCGMDFENSLTGKVGLRLVSWIDNHKGLIQHVNNIFNDFQRYRFDGLYSVDKRKEQADYSQQYKINFMNPVIDTVRAAKDNPYLLVFLQNIGVYDADYLYSQLFGRSYTMHEEILALRRKARLHRYLMINGSLTKAELDVYYSETTALSKTIETSIDATRKLSDDVEQYALKVQTEPNNEVYVDSYGIYLVQSILRMLRDSKQTLKISKEEYQQIVACYVTDVLERKLEGVNLKEYDQIYEALTEPPSYVRTAYPGKLSLERFLYYFKGETGKRGYTLNLCDLDNLKGVSGLKRLETCLRGLQGSGTVIFYGDVSDSLMLKLLKQSVKEYTYTEVNIDGVLEGLIQYTETWDDSYYNISVQEATGVLGVVQAIDESRTYILNEFDRVPEVVVAGGTKTMISGLQKQIQQMRVDCKAGLAFKKTPELFYVGETVQMLISVGKLRVNERVEILDIKQEDGKVKVKVKSESGESVVISIKADQKGICQTSSVFRHTYIRDLAVDSENKVVLDYANDIILVCIGVSIHEVLPLLCSGRRVHIIGKAQELKKRVRKSHAGDNPLRPLF